MAVNNGLDTKGIAKLFQQDVTDAMANFFRAETNARALTASRRKRIIRSHGHTYSYAKYQNTGQLARNIKITKDGDHKLVNDGTRADYGGKSYHGMYFLVEKKGESDVKATLKKGVNYANTLKL